jgi:multicomponent Na+:H+ antiporter subunit E
MLKQDKARPFAVLLLLLALAVSWILWSGLYKPMLLGLGIASCALSAYMAHRMGFFRHQAVISLLPQLPAYWWWLLREIFVSSLEVARVILQPSLPISPTVVTLQAKPETPVGQAILGNSITLSPGTVTLDVHEGQLLVHCLTRNGARALLAGETNRRAARLERS